MAHPTANLRLFVAIYPPHETARGMLKAMGKLDLPPHRETPLDQIHMTLQFVGDVPARDLDAVIESVERSAAGLGGFSLAPARLITLPERGPSRLVAAETDSPPPMMEMRRRLVTRLASDVRLKPDDRFRPHLTVCRFRRPTPMHPIDVPLPLAPFAVSQLVLMRSTLTPNGAKHHEVKSFALG
jgi:2'-5' RNA ligase